MTPLPLPTDNLYKFCALSGLVLFVLSVYVPINNLNEIALIRIETEYKLRLLHISSDDALIRAEEGLIDDAEVRLRAGYSLAELAEITYLTDKSELLLTRSGYLIKAMGFGMILGGALSAFGFYRWYYRIQKPADDQIRAAIKDQD